jgi:hypothetical protein
MAGNSGSGLSTRARDAPANTGDNNDTNHIMANLDAARTVLDRLDYLDELLEPTEENLVIAL